MNGDVKQITYKEACDFLLPRHYSGRKPAISKAFGWFFDGELKSVCTFGKPASPYLCNGIMKGEYAKNVYELNRLCRVDDLKVQLSQFVSACLRIVSKDDWIIVSYADTGMHHTGYIYQACNFIYTGLTRRHLDPFAGDNKHSRHYNKSKPSSKRKVRTPKHRYVFFATKNKKLKKNGYQN